ncbi:CDP-diacylglycerol--glycerol-3-phosphate 3-phosphatidyltransferase [Mesoaciditoga sp.]
MKITLATKITFVRVLLVVPFMYAALGNNRSLAIAALLIFVIASFTDFLDGKLARAMNEVSTLGKFVDQLADKVLVDAAFLVFLQKGEIGSWFVITVISRDIAVSGLRMMAAANSKVIAANWWGKLKTTSQMTFIIVMLLYEIIPFYGEWINVLLMWITFALTVWSGIYYFIQNTGVFEE